MTHATEEELVLWFYGEAADGPALERHLAECDACRAAWDAVRADMVRIESPPAPERNEAYGREVWARLAPRLERERRTPLARLAEALLSPRKWAVAGAVAALIAAAFLAGRWSHRPAEIVSGVPPQARERILLVAVGDHLERSQMVLLELVNTQPGAAVDISNEQQRAQDLLAANRLYRQTAARAGDAGVASVLDDLERVLIELANSPSRLSSSDFEDLRRRVEAQGILFKVRIIDSKVRQQAAGKTL